MVVLEPGNYTTPLGNTFADTWLEQYKSADPARKEPYGDEWAEKTSAYTKKTIASISGDRREVVVCLMRALRSPNPRKRVKVGSWAKYFFSTVASLPLCMRDPMMNFMFFTYADAPLPAALAEAS